MNYIIKSAEFSQCGKYRNKLIRVWSYGKPLALCIGLNPSTADAEKNDPTTRYLTSMLDKLGYGGYYLMNLFSFISSKPEALLNCEDPVGEADMYINEASLVCKDVILCWGGFKEATKRAKQVEAIFPNALCFGVNKNGTPYHPLAMMYNGKAKNPKLYLYEDEAAKAIKIKS